MDNKLLEEIIEKNKNCGNTDFSRVLSVNPEYKRLLIEFCDNVELQNLLNYALIDIKDGEEEHYISTGNYPSKRDSIMKLKYDLEFTRKTKLLKRGDKI